MWNVWNEYFPSQLPPFLQGHNGLVAIVVECDPGREKRTGIMYEIGQVRIPSLLNFESTEKAKAFHEYLMAIATPANSRAGASLVALPLDRPRRTQTRHQILCWPYKMCEEFIPRSLKPRARDKLHTLLIWPPEYKKYKNCRQKTNLSVTHNLLFQVTMWLTNTKGHAHMFFSGGVSSYRVHCSPPSVCADGWTKVDL